MTLKSWVVFWLLLLFEIELKHAPVYAVETAAGVPESQNFPHLSLHSELAGLVENSEYEIVSAYEVHPNGEYMTHEIMHHQRRKRSPSHLGIDSLHLRLHGFGHDFHMDLKTSVNLIAPGLMVQTLGKKGTKSVHTFPPEEFCFYQGFLRSHQNSSVALSTCKGLSGLIRTQETDYFLKPLPPHLALKLNYSASDGQHSHVLYKRSIGAQPHSDNEIMMIERKRELEKHNRLYQENQHLHNGFNVKHPQKQHFCGRRKKYMPKPPKEDLFILPDEYKYQLRNKRSLLKTHKNNELNVETLVVVDKKMMQNHGHENITTYVLTILNMVG